MSKTIVGGMDRRQLLKVLGLSAAAIGGASTLTACGGLKGSAGSTSDVLKIGFVSPQTGPLASFASADNYVVKQVQQALAKGFTAGGSTRQIEIIVKDTQSNSTRATAVTKELITQDQVDIVVGSGTPDTTNPVADQCEASGVPNITTIAPWEAWFHGRSGVSGEGFKYTTLFFFGMQEFADCFTPMWKRMDVANQNVAALWPDDTDANAFRKGLTPLAEAQGFKMIDGGAFQNGASDYSSQIAKFKGENAELFTCTPIPPDFQTFWKQAAQQDYRPKLATVAKVMLFPSEAEALGKLSNNIATDIWWSPFHPYQSSLDGTTAQQLADGFAEETGNQWTQALGSVYSLFELAVEGFKQASDPKDRDDVADKLRNMNTVGMSGPLDFTKGPEPGIAVQHPVGGQWRKGTKFDWDITIVDNTPNPDVPVGGDLEATNA
ncbi:ABC transporter substrate-binding protein [Arthrobacter sulfonylureivorans]|uniref:ABC transporter substrate-binding protein n=1 Tax=Arthrobacter sulfonylureivorans TaxID=2486855 RepID=A0ABY3WA50_9MICC|nr:ABC transporter substrate-binding protein [Arthrobacter sulfonylureivorans]UNK46342.1 ABC transporter substrate-binding protein [Arthrobacter sulfonylureivorans]